MDITNGAISCCIILKFYNSWQNLTYMSVECASVISEHQPQSKILEYLVLVAALSMSLPLSMPDVLMGLQSGDLTGVLHQLMDSASKKSLMFQDVCLASLSCMMWRPLGITSCRYGSIVVQLYMITFCGMQYVHAVTCYPISQGQTSCEGPCVGWYKNKRGHSNLCL